MKRSLLWVIFAGTLHAQVYAPPQIHVADTIANLPAYSTPSVQGQVWSVGDALNPRDCTIGGGNQQSLCISSGSGWIPYWGSGSALNGLYISQYGAKFDGQRATDCATTASSTTLTCTSSHFAPTDVGKTIAVQFAGTPSGSIPFEGGTLLTTIAAYVSPTQVTLAAAAGATVPGPRTIHVYYTTSWTETDGDLVNGDVGKKFEISEGGLVNTSVAGNKAPQQNMIARVTSPTVFTTSFNPGYQIGSATTPVAINLPGATIAWGTDDCVAWEKAIQAGAAQNRAVLVDGGISLSGCPIPVWHNTTIIGQGTGSSILAAIGGTRFADTQVGALMWQGGLYTYPTGVGAQTVGSVTTGPLGQCRPDWAQSPDGVNPPGTGYVVGDRVRPIETGASTAATTYCTVGSVTASGAPLSYTATTENGTGFFSSTDLSATAITGVGTGAKIIMMTGPVTNVTLKDFQIDMSGTGDIDATIFPKALSMWPSIGTTVENTYMHDCQATCFATDFGKNALIRGNQIDWGGKYFPMRASNGSAGIGIGTGLWPIEDQVITQNRIRYSGAHGIFVESQGVVSSRGIVISNNTLAWGATSADGIGDHGNIGTVIEGNQIYGFQSYCGQITRGGFTSVIWSDSTLISDNSCALSGWYLAPAGQGGITFVGNRIGDQLVGTGAAANSATGTGLSIYVNAGPITAATVNAAGSGCVTGDLLYINNGNGSGFLASVYGNATPAGVGSFSIIQRGGGYASGTAIAVTSSNPSCTGVTFNITAGDAGPVKVTDNTFVNVAQPINVYSTTGALIDLDITGNMFSGPVNDFNSSAININSGATVTYLNVDNNSLTSNPSTVRWVYGLNMKAGSTVTTLRTGTGNDFIAGATGTIANAGTLTNWIGPEMTQTVSTTVGTGTITIAKMFSGTTTFTCNAWDSTTAAWLPCVPATVTTVTLTGGTNTDNVVVTATGR